MVRQNEWEIVPMHEHDREPLIMALLDRKEAPRPPLAHRARLSPQLD